MGKSENKGFVFFPVGTALLEKKASYHNNCISKNVDRNSFTFVFLFFWSFLSPCKTFSSFPGWYTTKLALLLRVAKCQEFLLWPAQKRLRMVYIAKNKTRMNDINPSWTHSVSDCFWRIPCYTINAKLNFDFATIFSWEVCKSNRHRCCIKILS